MGLNSYSVLLVACLCLLYASQLNTAPLVGSTDGFCSGHDTLKYEIGNEYFYDYSTETDLWINDVSKDSKSSAKLTATVSVRGISPCTYVLIVADAKLSGDSVGAADLTPLTLETQFKLNSRGELGSTLGFVESDPAWSRNIKRGIISAFQTKSVEDLRNKVGSEKVEDKSAVVYETDVLGRCRTTYSVEKAGSELKLEKKKSLQSCTLNNNQKITEVFFTKYRHVPEFYNGRLFIETYECESTIKNELINKVVCEERSTYKVGSRGVKGVQAIVKQTLTFKSSNAGYDRRALGPFDDASVTFEYAEKSRNELVDFNLQGGYLNDLCKRINEKQGLNYEHSQLFRDAVNKLEGLNTDQLLELHKKAKQACPLAANTVLQAIVFANTEDSFNAALTLLDQDEFKEQKSIAEFPLLSALARNKKPSAGLINKFKSYLEGKSGDFAYLNKLYLVYSSMVNSHCDNENCDENKLNEYSALFAKNLGSNCADASNKDLVVSSLKAIGNIGSFKNVDVLNACAKNKDNSLETRVSAIQSFRRFSCENRQGKLTSFKDIIPAQDEDTEVRINAFQIAIQCADHPDAQQTVIENFPKLIENEQNVQFLTYVVDYAREHGLTILLNPILNNPKIKEKFQLNFKELSFNNYKFRYNVGRDSALEVELNGIYASDRAFVPRSLRINATLHSHGISVNFVDATLRVEGADDVLKAIIINKLTHEDIVKQLTEAPEQLIEILKALADKLKYVADKPYVSLSLKMYGSEIYFSQLDNKDELTALARWFVNPRESYLYGQYSFIKNVLLVDSNVRQPLANGFEFNTFFDFSGAFLLSKDSTKTEEGEEKKFNINNFKSLSATINKRFEIHLTDKSRLALKKRVVLNARLRTNVVGFKRPGQAEYNLHLSPEKEIPVLTVDGKFFKLGSNNKYTEINDFTVEAKKIERCTSSKFHIATGIDLCLSVSRPQVGGSLIKALQPVDLDTLLEDDEEDNVDDHEDDNDDHDDDHDDDDDDDDEKEKKAYNGFNRPKLTLSGPYHYHVTLKNPDGVKSLILRAEYQRDEEGTELLAKAYSVSASGEETERVELAYDRKRTYSNLGFQRKISLELRVPSTSSVPFKALAEIQYQKKDSMKTRIEIDNKILTESHLLLNYVRERKAESDVTPHVELEILLDSKIRYPKFYRLFFDIEPSGKDIKSDLIFEYSNPSTNGEKVKALDSILTLNSASESQNEYNLDWQIDTARPSKAHLYGIVSTNLFNSNVDLQLEYEGPTFKLSTPVALKVSHRLDLSGNSKSHIELGVRLPKRSVEIDHNIKLIFEADAGKLQINHFEVQIVSPNSLVVDGVRQPKSVYISRHRTTSANGETAYDLSFGINNFQVDLSTRPEGDRLASILTKVDKSPIVKSFGISYSRNTNPSDNSRRSLFQVKKNEVAFIVIDGSIASQSQDNQFKLLSSLNLKALDFTGNARAKFDIEDNKSNVLGYNLEVTAENLIRILFKIISINSQAKVDINNKKVDFKFEITKLGEVKSVKLASTGALRTGSTNEFDVSYNKVLSNGQTKTGNGVVKFSWVPGKKVEAKLDVANALTAKFALKKEQLSDENVSKEAHLRYAHLDDPTPSEREFKLFHATKTESGSSKQVTFNALAKKGEPSKFENVDALSYLIDINTQNTHLTTKESGSIRVNGDNSVQIKLLQYRVDWKSSLRTDLKSKQGTANIDVTVKFPAMFSDPGKQNFVTQKLNYVRNQSTRKSTLSYSLESDNKFVNDRFKKANIDYVREAVNDQNQLNLDIKLTKTDGTQKTANIKVERKSCENLLSESQKDDDDDEIKDAFKLCSGGKIFIKQDIVPTWQSKFAPGKSFDATQCEVETKLIRKKDGDYLLDTLVAVTCKDKKLVKNSVYIHRDLSDEHQGKFQARLEAYSDLYYPHSLYELKLKKPTRESGQVEISGIRDNREFTQKINYERTLDEATGKLVKGSYQLSSVRNNGTTKYARSCDLKIEVGTNYYHKMACQVESPLLPAAANFGYSIKSNNWKENLFGKRDLEAELTLPTGRTLRLESKGQRKTPISGEFDHDDDNNDDREFESQHKIFIDYTRQPNRYIIVNAKRDNYENSKSKLSVEVLHYPGVRSGKITVDRARLGSETTYKLTAEYELESSAKNSLEWSASLFSDLDQRKIETELNLQRPKVNLAYKNKFDKRTGALQELNVRFGKLVKFVVEKDDPENRKISVVLVSPDESAYDVETKVLDSFSKHYKVQSTLKSKAGDVLSTLTSTFDSNNNNLVVDINANKNGQTYQLNFGIYDEKHADTYLLRNGKKVAQASLSIKSHDDHCDIELHAEWNRVWSQLRQDLLGLSSQEIASSTKYHSYFGDVYGELEKELKPTVDSLRETRKALQQDFLQSLYLYVDYYKYYMPQRLQDKIQELAKKVRSESDEKDVEALPLFKRLAIRYNRLSDLLNGLRERVQKKSARLARRIPILAKISYNNDASDGFENDLTISKRTYRAHNLYQLNRLYRERVRRLSARMERTKADLVRRDRGASLKQLYHKYKFRSLTAYTQVATIYNRRNVIAFNGQLRVLKTKCQYLLAHDLAKNKFSVILNNNDQEGIITVHAYGQPAIDISATKALVNNKAVSLPYEVNVPNKNAKVVVRRVHNGVSLEIIEGLKNLQVACYGESNSCTVGLTRFYVGKVNGLLGKSNHDLDNDDSNWFLGNTCKATAQQARKPTDDAVRTCFVKFSRAPFNPLKKAFLVVRPDGWQKMCENALSVDPSAKCALLKAYAIHARIRNVEVHEPKECNQCSSNGQNYAIDKRVKSADSSKLVAEGSDFAFVFLPCDKQSAKVDSIKNFLGGVAAKNPKNKYYFVKVGPKGASIYQNEKGEAHNVNIEQALNAVTESKNTNEFNKEYFAHGLFLAASLFSDRVSQARRIVIVSCGNCVAYDPIDTLRLSYYLKQRNIMVSSFGQYDMIDEDNSSGSEQVVGHTSTHVLLYDNEEKSLITDGIESYSIDHKIDLCSRLASRTKGAVYNIALAAQPGVLEQIAQKINEIAPKFSVHVNKCVRIETPFGDFDDFNFSRKQIDDEL